MINNLLALINQEGSLGFGEACIYAVIGFCIVFVGIVLIILIIWLIGLLMRKTDNLAFLSRIGKKKKTGNTAPVHDIKSNDGEEVSDEVKAAIIAALMAYYTEEKPECEFKVRRIKRI